MERTILFISTETGDADLIGRILSSVGVRVDHVSTLQEARRRLARESYSALLTASEVPDGSWTDVVDAVQHCGAAVPIVVTHPAADDSFWAEVLNLGCYDLLVQPFDCHEVQRIMALACKQPIAAPVGVALPLPKRTLSAAC